MILRAQPIGQPPSRRWVIQHIKKNTVWDGVHFVEDWDKGRVYAHPSDACADMSDILKDFYSGMGKKTYVIPIEVEVFGNVTKNEIAMWLHRSSILNIKTHEHGNGPGISLVAPTIHWGLIREIEESAFEGDNPDWKKSNENK